MMHGIILNEQIEVSKPAAQRNRLLVQAHHHCSIVQMLLSFLDIWQ